MEIDGGGRGPRSRLMDSPHALRFELWNVSLPGRSFHSGRAVASSSPRVLGDPRDRSRARPQPHVKVSDPLRLFPSSASSSVPPPLLGCRIFYFFLAFSKSRLHKTRVNLNMTNIKTIATTGFRSRKGVRSARWGIFMSVNAGRLGSRREAWGIVLGELVADEYRRI